MYFLNQNNDLVESVNSKVLAFDTKFRYILSSLGYTIAVDSDDFVWWIKGYEVVKSDYQCKEIFIRCNMLVLYDYGNKIWMYRSVYHKEILISENVEVSKIKYLDGKLYALKDGILFCNDSNNKFKPFKCNRGLIDYTVISYTTFAIDEDGQFLYWNEDLLEKVYDNHIYTEIIDNTRLLYVLDNENKLYLAYSDYLDKFYMIPVEEEISFKSVISKSLTGSDTLSYLLDTDGNLWIHLFDDDYLMDDGSYVEPKRIESEVPFNNMAATINFLLYLTDINGQLWVFDYRNSSLKKTDINDCKLLQNNPPMQPQMKSARKI